MRFISLYKTLSIVFLVIYTTSINKVNCQNIYFPHQYYKDSISLITHLPILAAKLVTVYKEKDRSTYLDNLFRLQTLSGNYIESIETLNKFRDFNYSSDFNFGRSIGAQFESFALAKLEYNKSKLDFDIIYGKILEKMTKGMTDRALYNLSNYFNTSIIDLKDRFYKQLTTIDSAKDSISVDVAIKLCRNFNTYIVFDQILFLGKKYTSKLSVNQLIIEDSVLIKTRDGSILSARIARRKDQKDKSPCIMMLNIYANKADQNRAIQAALNGYVGIVVNTRGKYLSPDSIIPYEYDGRDAYDAIDWISKQDWCDGRVGMYGGSYLGFIQWAAAKQMHPALKTIVPQVSVLPGLENVYRGGVFLTNELSNIHDLTKGKFAVVPSNLDDQVWESLQFKWYSSGKAFDALDTLEGRPNAIFHKYIKHSSYDAYWQNMVPYKKDFMKINIPILSITGHFDGNLRGSFYYFKEHYKYNKNAEHYMLFGPYDHFGAQNNPTDLGDFKLDSVARLSIYSLVWNWFDYVFKGKPKPVILKDKLNYEVIGKNKWKHSSTISTAANNSIVFYFNSRFEKKNFTLTSIKGRGNEFISQIIDLKDRSDSSKLNTFDHSDSINIVSNSISLISNTLNEDIEIGGEFLLNATIEINKKDMDIEATLLELDANGGVFTLSEVTNRLSYLEDPSNRNLLIPNKKTILPSMIGKFASKKVSKGSKIKLVLRILKSPYQQINYGTGKDVSTESIKDAGEPLQIKWYNDSYIKIPVWRDPSMLRPQDKRKN